MKKSKLFFILVLLWALCINILAQTYTNEPITATWALDENPPIIEANVNLKNVFTTAALSYGKMTIKDVAITNETSFVRFVPGEQVSGNNIDCALTFNLFPVSGYTFSPKEIKFKVLQYGTGSGRIRVSGKTSSGIETILLEETNPGRGDRDDATTEITIPLSDISVSKEAYIVTIYIYNVATNKQVGFSDVNISGTINGSPQTGNSYTINVANDPVDAGSVNVSPQGNSFEEGSLINLSATTNFGYRFINWTDENNTVLSTDPSFVHIMNSDVIITANYEKKELYYLDVSIEGGANNYMVQVTPEGTIVDGKAMYEDGVTVTVSAKENPIISFLNWEDNSTQTERSIIMNENKNLSATYEAVDYIAGWDFYKSGSSNRVADFSSTEDNKYSSLVLRNEDGNTLGWLDKSIESANGYDGIGAGLVWKEISERYYFQTKINASEFQSIKVSSKMWYNYKAYITQQLQWSLDGENWTTLATASLINKVWVPLDAELPSAADNVPELYLRWIPDYNSPLSDTESTTDGTGIGAIYITGLKKLIDDGTAPILKNSNPAEGSSDVSASGKILLTFDEKIKTAEGCFALLNGMKLTPTVTGTTMLFNYSGLNYDTEYTFTLSGNNVSDLSDNYQTENIQISFRTMKRPSVSSTLFNYIVKVGDADDLKKALEEANASPGVERYRIFVPAGEYNLGDVYGTAVTRSNISIIGENMETTIIRNNPPEAGIGVTATIFINRATDTYIQDITLKNDWPYFERNGGVAVCLQDKGDKTILKNVRMLSYQDTYFSDNASMRSYIEDSEIHGTVDFICGGGDVFFNRSLIYLEDRGGNVITAPRGTPQWGYVFNDCTIDGAEINNGGYSLGRPWAEEPRSIYLNTTMKIIPKAEGWSSWYAEAKLFAEYNSQTPSGTPVDCGSRNIGIILTDDQAAEYTINNVLSGNDGWMPALIAEQTPAPVISLTDEIISWEANEYALCYLIFKDGVFVQQTTQNEYMILEDGEYSVYATNEMGGLSIASNIVTVGQQISKTDQIITFDDLAPVAFGTADFNLGATSTSGLAVVYTSSNLNVATIINNKVHIIGAGTTSITATQEGNDNYNPAIPVTKELTIDKANQYITFEELPELIYGAVDFSPVAVSSSGLEVTYMSSNLSVATIVNHKVHIIGAGTTTITATQTGNNNFNAAMPVSKELKILPNEIIVKEFKINGLDYLDNLLNSSIHYVVPENYLGDEINISIDAGQNTVIDKGSNFEIRVDKPSVQIVNIKLSANGVQPKEFSFKIEKRFKFAEIVTVKWNHMLVANNNKGNNGGFKFNSYQWYRNGEKVGSDKQSYRETTGGLADYYLKIKTDNQEELRTWEATLDLHSSKMKLYPNPANKSDIINVDVSFIDDNKLTSSYLEVLNTTGDIVHKRKMDSSTTTLDLSSMSPGMYFVRVTYQDYSEVVKMILR